MNKYSFSLPLVLISNESYTGILKKIAAIKNNAVRHLFVPHRLWRKYWSAFQKETFVRKEEILPMNKFDSISWHLLQLFLWTHKYIICLHGRIKFRKINQGHKLFIPFASESSGITWSTVQITFFQISSTRLWVCQLFCPWSNVRGCGPATFVILKNKCDYFN